MTWFKRYTAQGQALFSFLSLSLRAGHLNINTVIVNKRGLMWIQSRFMQNNWYDLKSGSNIFPSGFTESDSSCFHCSSERLNAIWAVCPGNRSVHHPGDASLLAAMCQYFAYSLTGCHAVCRSQLLLHSPLFGRTRKHRDRRAAGEHLGCHMVLAAKEHQPVVERLVRPGCLPAPILHSQSHLLQVPGVSVHKGRVHGFIFIRAGLRLRGCLTQTPSCEVWKHSWPTALNLT